MSLSNFFSDSKNILYIVEYFNKFGQSVISVICVILLEIYAFIHFRNIEGLELFYVEYWCCLLLFIVITYAVWLIWSRRLFFRDKWRVLYWIVGYNIVLIVFPILLYPKIHLIAQIPYSRIAGTVVWGFFWFYVCKYIKAKWFVNNKLIVVFAIASETNIAERKIRDSIKNAIMSIESDFEDIEIVVPPFGYKNKVQSYERYIKRGVTQADALIYAQVIDGQDDGNLGYVFTKFTSRINEKRHKNLNSTNNKVMNEILELQGYQEWNNINSNQNEVISKWRIANNLEGMLLMYCSALYMLKNDYNTALPVAKKMFKIDVQNRQNKAAASLLSIAYFRSALNLEHKQHNYQAAYDNISECVELFPWLKNHIEYLQAMARLLFYLGDLRKSKTYTKSFKKGHEWEYNLNMGFYAIYENKVDEFINRYKKLPDYYTHKEMVRFAIEFLEYEEDKSNDKNYSKLLHTAIAFLYSYIDSKKALKYRNDIVRKYNKDESYSKINALLEIIERKQNKLLLVD